MTAVASRPTAAALVRAEVRKLASRASVRLALATMALIGVGVPVAVRVIAAMLDMPAEAADGTDQSVSFDLYVVLRSTLMARSFFVFRAFVIAVVAVSVAGEFQARTLREDLVRPVTRGQVLFAKWSAIQVFVAAGALIPLVLALPVGAVLSGTDGAIGQALIRFGLTWLADAGFATLVLAISFGIRSVPGTIGGVFLFYILDWALGVALWGVQAARGLILTALEQMQLKEQAEPVIDAIIQARPWLPSAAFALQGEYDPNGFFPWRPLVSLAIVGVLSYAAAWGLFRRVDVD